VREPVFNETLQISIVVRDLDATMQTYVEEYGIGPWEVYEFNPETMTKMEPVDFHYRIAVTMVGSVQWELVQPLEQTGPFAEFLAAKGEGVHHIAVAGRPYAETKAAIEAKGRRALLGGIYNGVTFSYMTTDEDLGVVTELFDWPEGLTQEPDRIYP
jgi:glyoxalase/bleomycin resistance protein/dioxygenase superfamily protein